MQKYLFITTCGTSILSNNLSLEDRSKLTKLANHHESEFSTTEKTFIDDIINKKNIPTLAQDLVKSKSACAELNGIITFYNSQFSSNSSDLHFLMHTDTYQGKKTVELLQSWLQEKNCNSNLLLIEDLNTKSLVDFKHGISFLIHWCSQTLPGYRASGYKIIFNLSGGFKSLQGYMQTLGMLYADELLYIFENNNELLRIPRLPLELDSSVVDAIKQNLSTFRMLSNGLTLNKAAVANIAETLFFEIGDEVELSPWGQLGWERFKKLYYATKIYCPLEPIKLSDNATRDLQKLPQFNFAFNQKMDTLYYYLKTQKHTRSVSVR